jgi:CRP-like cAMP-binding protein
MLQGASVFAYGVTNVIQLIANMDTNTVEFMSKMDIVNVYMTSLNVPKNVRGRVREFLQYKYQQKVSFIMDEGQLLGMLSTELKREVLMSLYEPILIHVPFFAQVDPVELKQSFYLICDCLVRKYYGPKETVFSQGSPGNAMYLLIHGFAAVFKDGAQVSDVVKNTFVGEVALVEDTPHSTTCITGEHCELAALAKTDFHAVLEHFPAMREQIDTYCTDQIVGAVRVAAIAAQVVRRFVGKIRRKKDARDGPSAAETPSSAGLAPIISISSDSAQGGDGHGLADTAEPPSGSPGLRAVSEQSKTNTFRAEVMTAVYKGLASHQKQKGYHSLSAMHRRLSEGSQMRLEVERAEQAAVAYRQQKKEREVRCLGMCTDYFPHLASARMCRSRNGNKRQTLRDGRRSSGR